MYKKLLGFVVGLSFFFTLAALASLPAQASASTLTQAQISAIIGLLQSFGAPASVIQNVQAVLAPGTVVPSSGSLVLTRNLSLGSTGSDVTQLQQFLVAQGLLSATPTGYFGSLTQAAVQRYQSIHNIVSSGSPNTTGYGAVGPKTRASIAVTSVSSTTGTGSTGTTTQPPATTSGPTFTSGGGGGGGGGTIPSPPPPTPPSAPPPTASYTINGSTNVTLHVGDTVTYAWSSTDAVSATSNYTQDSSSCGVSGTGPFDLGFTPTSGSASEKVTNCWAGHTYTTTVTATDSQGRKATATATITVPTPDPTATLTVNGGTNATLHVGDTLNLAWSSTGGTSYSLTYTQDSSNCGVSGTGPFKYWGNSTVPASYSEQDPVTDCWAGHTYTFTFTATDSQGRKASASATVTVAPAASSVRTYQSGNMLYLDTGTAKIGVDLNWGASIVDIEKGTASYVNRHDLGREIQFAFWNRDEQYGDVGCTGGPFGWNPQQAGDAYLNENPALSWSLAGNTIYSKTQAMEWCNGGGPGNPVQVPDIVMEQWISAVPQFSQAFKVHYKITYTGTKSYATSGQNLPAIFSNGAYHNFMYYSGTMPWTNAPLTTITGATPFGKEYYDSEQWAALVDDTGDGLAVYTPVSLPYVTPNIATPESSDASPTSDATNYFAPFVTGSLVPGAVLEGDFYIIVGNYADARSVVYQLRTLYPSTASSAPFGTLETPSAGAVAKSTLTINGWVFGSNPIARIDALIDGIKASSITPGTVARADVQNDYPSAPLNSGFNSTINITQFPSGSHVLTLQATDTKGNTGIVAMVPVTFGTNQQPTGALDTVAANGLASGWTLDPDSSSVSSSVALYVDGPKGQGTLVATIPTTLLRSDVNSSLGVTGIHGFSWQVPPQYLNGNHTLYAYGIDTSDSSITALLDGSPKAYAMSIPSAYAPTGSFDNIVNGVLGGWVVDEDAPAVSASVAVYMDGPKGQGTLVVTIPTNVLRSDVNSIKGITGNHGFVWPIPSQYQTGSHSWYVYGVDITNSSSLTLLGGSPK